MLPNLCKCEQTKVTIFFNFLLCPIHTQAAYYATLSICVLAQNKFTGKLNEVWSSKASLSSKGDLFTLGVLHILQQVLQQ